MFNTLKAFPSYQSRYNISILEAKFINVFKMCKLAVNFEICEEKFTLVIVNFKSRMEDVRYVEFAVKAVFP